jgi:tetratricopeptide (TPR) repeat protein
MAKRAAFGGIFVLLLIISSGVRFPELAAKAIKNAALLWILKSPACDPDWYVCDVIGYPYPRLAFDGNQQDLQKAKAWLIKVNKLIPGEQATLLRLAEIEFSLGDRFSAARYLAQVGSVDPGMSSILQQNRYETQLLEGYMAVDQGKWKDAVYHFRQGLSWGDERVLERDQSEYLHALSKMMVENWAESPISEKERHLVVKYLIEAGAIDEAEGEIEKLIRKTEAENSPSISELLGRLEEKRGNFKEAIKYYKIAVESDLEFRIAILKLIFLGENDSITIAKEQIGKLGPEYRLGAYGGGYREDKTASNDNGWTLVGYDLDQDLLIQAHFLDVWLWWKKTDGEPLGSGWINIGDFWLQKQRVVNLFPNPGFEWGVDERGIPLGHDGEFYGAPESYYGLRTITRDGEPTNVFYISSDVQYTDVGLVSRLMPIHPSDQYLMSGWLWDQARNNNIGRLCIPFDPDQPYQYYLANDYSIRMAETWTHIADIAIAYIPDETLKCRSILQNNHIGQIAQWDNILWSRISIPSK